LRYPGEVKWATVVYVAVLLANLTEMAEKAEFPTLVYRLGMARTEAEAVHAVHTVRRPAETSAAGHCSYKIAI